MRQVDAPPSSCVPAVAAAVAFAVLTGCSGPSRPPGASLASPAADVQWQPVQADLFSAPGAQPNAWADYDNDGDLDLFVGFRGGRNRLYRNDGGRFTDVAEQVGIADPMETRAAAWGDFDADGHLDLYVGFTPRSSVPDKLYRNEGDGRRYTDVAQQVGITAKGTTRQPAFVDYDGDGDVDLFVAFRDRPNMLFRNDGGRFTEVGAAVGIADTRKTVGVVWFDIDVDGDLDAFVANQEGDANGLYRNDGGRFTDVASQWGVAEAGRATEHGGVGPAVLDFDNDGDLDLFVASYGPDALYRNDGGRFTDVGPAAGVAPDDHTTTAAAGDYDNDGDVDVYVASYLADQLNARDHLYRNDGGGRFTDALPEVLHQNDASHGVQWADFDADGDLDLALANNHARGTHSLFRNLLPAEAARRSLHVLVLDAAGRHTRAGAEVRAYRAGTRQLLGTRLVDTGGGYDSQSVMPVHFGLPRLETVDVEVTVVGAGQRRVTRVAGVDPARLRGKPVVVRAR